MNSISCEHGALKRSCQLCEYEAEISSLRAENDHLRDTTLCIIRCPTCGSESAGSNEAAINKEVARLRAIVARVEDVEGMAKIIGKESLGEAFEPFDADLFAHHAFAARDYILGEG